MAGGIPGASLEGQIAKDAEPGGSLRRFTDEAKSDLKAGRTRRLVSALGRLGGLKGGKARAAKLSTKRRKEIAKKAAKTRWVK